MWIKVINDENIIIQTDEENTFRLTAFGNDIVLSNSRNDFEVTEATKNHVYVKF